MLSDLNYVQTDPLTTELAIRKLGANSHIAFDGAYYSAPYSLYGQMVIVRANKATIDILDSTGKCVASHSRSYTKRKYITEPAHMPSSYCSTFSDGRYDGDKLIKWAKNIGVNTYEIIDLLLDTRQFEEHAYKSCMALLQLSKKFSPSVLEKACGRALNSKKYSYSAIQKFAKHEYDLRVR